SAEPAATCAAMNGRPAAVAARAAPEIVAAAAVVVRVRGPGAGVGVVRAVVVILALEEIAVAGLEAEEDGHRPDQQQRHRFALSLVHGARKADQDTFANAAGDYKCPQSLD